MNDVVPATWRWWIAPAVRRHAARLDLTSVQSTVRGRQDAAQCFRRLPCPPDNCRVDSAPTDQYACIVLLTDTHLSLEYAPWCSPHYCFCALRSFYSYRVMANRNRGHNTICLWYEAWRVHFYASVNLFAYDYTVTVATTASCFQVVCPSVSLSDIHWNVVEEPRQTDNELTIECETQMFCRSQ